MIPSLIYIKSSKRSFLTLTLKKNVNIGTHEDSDIIINHPDFRGRGVALGQIPPKRTLPESKKIKIPSLIPRYNYKTEGLTVYLVKLKVLFITALVGVAGTLLISIRMASHGTLALSQDWTPIALPAQDSYGYFRHDKKHTEGVRFTFEAQRDLLHRLYFILGGSGDGTSVALRLNGVPVSESLLLPTGWSGQTSLTLPSDYTKNGKNTIEVLPTNPKNKKPEWGISEVRVEPVTQPAILTHDSKGYNLELIIKALKQADISGKELGYYYKIVNQWPNSLPLPDASLSKSTVLKQIESRMESVLYQVAFDIKSKEILDDHDSAQELREKTSRWIPVSWVKGWNIYNELCR